MTSSSSYVTATIQAFRRSGLSPRGAGISVIQCLAPEITTIDKFLPQQQITLSPPSSPLHQTPPPPPNAPPPPPTSSSLMSAPSHILAQCKIEPIQVILFERSGDALVIGLTPDCFNRVAIYISRDHQFSLPTVAAATKHSTTEILLKPGDDTRQWGAELLGWAASQAADAMHASACEIVFGAVAGTTPADDGSGCDGARYFFVMYSSTGDDDGDGDGVEGSGGGEPNFIFARTAAAATATSTTPHPHIQECASFVIPIVHFDTLKIASENEKILSAVFVAINNAAIACNTTYMKAFSEAAKRNTTLLCETMIKTVSRQASTIAACMAAKVSLATTDPTQIKQLSQYSINLEKLLAQICTTAFIGLETSINVIETLAAKAFVETRYKHPEIAKLVPPSPSGWWGFAADDEGGSACSGC